MAILSLEEEGCKEMVGETRTILLPRYVAATKTALLRGAAIRAAEVMGVHLDGTLLGLSPFETEIRRRIWWQLRLHDFRAAELTGQAKFRHFELDETTPKKPANVNDSELYPAMLGAPAESPKPTEMTWSMFRTEMASFAATQKANMQKLRKVVLTSDEYVAMGNLELKNDFIRDVEELIETKYLRFCDPSQPLQLFTMLSVRISTNIVQFMAPPSPQIGKNGAGCRI